MKDILDRLKAQDIFEQIFISGGGTLGNDSTLKKPKEFSTQKEFEFDDSSIKIAPKAKFAISLFNNKKDEDNQKIVNTSANDNLDPLLTIDNANAYMKYGLVGGVDGEGSIEFETLELPVSVGITGSLQYGLFAYHRHSRDTTVLQALYKDLKEPRNFIQASSINDLKEGQAVAFQWVGKAGFKATIEWADLLSSIAPSLAKFKADTDILKLSIGIGASTTIDFSYDDTYLIVVSKNDDKKYIVEVRKSDSFAKGVSTKVGIEVNTELSKAAADKIEELKESVTAQALEVSKPVLQKLKKWAASTNRLPPELKQSAKKAIEKQLGVPIDQVDAAAEKKLKEAINGLFKTISEKAHTYAKQTIKLGFEWSYRTVKSGQTLIRAEFDSFAKFRPFHRALLKGDIAALQEKTKEDPADFFLQTLSFRRISKFSMGASLGKLSNQEYSFSKDRTVTITKDREGKIQPSFTMTSDLFWGEETKRSDEDQSYSVGLSGQSSDMRDANAFKLSDFDELTFSLAQTNSDNIATKSEIQDYVDTARIWGYIPGDLDSLKSVVNAIYEIGKTKKLKIAGSLTLNREALIKLLTSEADASATDKDLWSVALALGMQGFQLQSELYDLDTRIAFYGPVMYKLIETRVYDKIKGLNDTALNQFPQLTKIADLDGTIHKEHRAGRALGRNYKIIREHFSHSALALKFCKPSSISEIGRLAENFRSYVKSDNSPSLNAKKLQDFVETQLKSLAEIAKNRVLMRAIGAFVIMKAENIGYDTSLIERRFHVEATDKTGTGPKKKTEITTFI